METNNQPKEVYQEIYDAFIQKFNRAETTPTEAGEALVKIASFFPNYNTTMIKAERLFSMIRKSVALEVDETTGKSISVAKADTISDASQEAFEYKQARGHVQNIEALIAALKFLQKSLEVEYLNSNI